MTLIIYSECKWINITKWAISKDRVRERERGRAAQTFVFTTGKSQESDETFNIFLTRNVTVSSKH